MQGQQQQQLQEHCQAQQGSSSRRQAHAIRSCIDVEQITACINMAVTHSQLEAVCNTFLHHPAFSSRHAALVVSRLHKVQRRTDDRQLLLLELLATKISAALPTAEPNEGGSTCSNSTSSSSGGGGSSNKDQALEQVVLPPKRWQLCCGVLLGLDISQMQFWCSSFSISFGTAHAEQSRSKSIVVRSSSSSSSRRMLSYAFGQQHWPHWWLV